MKWGGLLVVACCLFTSAIACTPRVRVLANPTPHDKGIRYYRPKPYLLVSSGVAEVAVSEKEKTVTTKSTPDPRYVNIQLVYLPDFEEEYAIDVRSGFGTADVAIKLEDGWNLTELNQKLDSQTDENLKAISELVGAIGKLPTPTAQGESNSKSLTDATPSCTVRASNVPLGYYESVLGRDARGRKRLYGFRYVGFLPYANCPQSMAGFECNTCETADLYGLVFENEAMVFRRLSDIQNLPPEAQFASAASKATETPQAQVTRNIEYNSKGEVAKATVSIVDTFSVPSTRDRPIQVPLPTLKNPTDASHAEPLPARQP
ncbi:MAG: hypothetical protein ACK5OB_17210 [Pirellula sp.]